MPDMNTLRQRVFMSLSQLTISPVFVDALRLFWRPSLCNSVRTWAASFAII